MGRLKVLGWGVALLCAACGAARSSAVKPPRAEPETQASPAHRYVDEELGFEIVRSSTEWQLDETEAKDSPEGLTIPVILKHRTSGAQVVLQVAPAVATPIQFAERLNEGLSEQPGFRASELEPIPLSDSAVGFNFQVGAEVSGRVAVMEGSPGRVFMMMATWATEAPEDVSQSVEDLFGAVRPLPERG